jgi:hypothetical protein
VTAKARDQRRISLDAIYNEVFNEMQADLYRCLVSGPSIQHHPLFPNPFEVIVGYVNWTGIPCDIKRAAIDGHLGFCSCALLGLGLSSEERRGYRCDVLQSVPKDANNKKTGF